MKQLADGVWQLSGFPPNAINVYVIEDVLIDASTRYATRRILRQLDGHEINAHALTHAHPDHQGASHAVCERLGIPTGSARRMPMPAEDPSLIEQRQPDHFMARLFYRTCTGPGHPVDRRLAEGDGSASSRSCTSPGTRPATSPSGVRRTVCSSPATCFNAADPFTGIPGLKEPRWYFTPDPAANRRSAKRLGELEP